MLLIISFIWNNYIQQNDNKNIINLQEREGNYLQHACVIGKGKVYIFDTLNPDGSILDYQQILHILYQIHAQIDNETSENAVPILSNDERTQWAKVFIQL